MARFTGIPALAQSGLEEWQFRVLSAMKENVELLTGTRGERDGSSRALTKGDVTVSSVPAPQFTSLSARGVGVTLSGQPVPTLADYSALVRDVQLLANDVATLRAILSTLLTDIKR